MNSFQVTAFNEKIYANARNQPFFFWQTIVIELYEEYRLHLHLIYETFVLSCSSCVELPLLEVAFKFSLLLVSPLEIFCSLSTRTTGRQQLRFSVI